MIEVKNFSLQLNHISLLKKINLQVEVGKPLTIIGESGAGKSTLAKSLLGDYPGVASGEILVNGDNILRYNRQQLQRYRRQDIAIVPQSTAESLNPQRTVMQHLLENGVSEKILHQDVMACAKQCLQQFQVPESLWHRYPKGLSGGEIQRILLAIAMMNHPHVLVLDEPSSALDKALREKLQRQILDLTRERCLVWISHDLKMAAKMVGDIAVMHQGGVVEYNTVEALFNQPKHAYTRELLAQDLPYISPVRQNILSCKNKGTHQKELVCVTLKNVSKAYGKNQVLCNVNLTLKQGETIALFGDSGMGKSTLGRIIAGLIPPDTGSLQLGQESHRIAWISQHPIRALPPHFTLFDAIAEPLVLQKYQPQKIRQIVLDSLQQVKLDNCVERLKQRVHKFSGGELQRIVLARTLVAKPQTIIADEITASLDKETCHHIIRLLLALQQKESVSLLFITHDEALGKHIAHRCLSLQDGALLGAT